MILLLMTVALTACDGAVAPPDAGPPQRGTPQQTTPVDDTDLYAQLRLLNYRHGLTGNPAVGCQLPSINEPLAQLGKQLFFTKALSGDFNVACASCHHPVLGGAGGLSLPVGIATINPDLVGRGRSAISGLPGGRRNSPTIFNAGLFDAGLFNVNLNSQERNQLVEFLPSLTDPCVLSRSCLAPWIAAEDEAADGHQLHAVDANGNRI